MNWISVDDRLPEEDIWIFMGSSTHDFVEQGMYLEGIFVNPDINYLGRPTITHWMPLPKPPKEKA